MRRALTGVQRRRRVLTGVQRRRRVQSSSELGGISVRPEEPPHRPP